MYTRRRRDNELKCTSDADADSIRREAQSLARIDDTPNIDIPTRVFHEQENIARV